MEKKKKKVQTDINKIAAYICDVTTKEINTPDVIECKPEKNPAAVALGRLGGLKGGKARAESLSPKKRKEIAKKAASVRWKKQDR
jgi:hypothetical protein